MKKQFGAREKRGSQSFPLRAYTQLRLVELLHASRSFQKAWLEEVMKCISLPAVARSMRLIVSMELITRGLISMNLVI